MKQPSTQLIAALSGVTLLLAGLALVLAAWVGGPTPQTTSAADAAQAATPAAEPDAVDGIPAQNEGRFQPDPASPALAVGPDGAPEPYWRTKQREAREELLRSGGAGAGGAASTVDGSTAETAPPTSTTSPPRPAVPTTRTVYAGGQTPLAGTWAGTAEELAAYLLAENPGPGFTVPVSTLAQYYVRYAAEVGLRADILWAQMLHETGFGAYGGDVRPSQNNFAGIGATGGGASGFTFPTAEAGVQAHIAHMVAYVFTQDRAPWTNAAVDPRYGAVSPRGVARVLSDLDGRWAVPGVGYGAAIERRVAAINR